MMAATRSESALVRPFAGISSADIPLKEARLLVDSDEHQEGVLTLPSGTLSNCEFSLHLPSASSVREHVEQTSVPVVDCGLVVMLTGRSHRVTKVLIQDYLRLAEWPTDLVLRRDEADLILNDREGFTLTVAVVLLNDLVQEPLRPYMAGTWLARRVFSIRSEQESTSFSILAYRLQPTDTFMLTGH